MKNTNSVTKYKQIDGTMLAPPKVGSWPKSCLFQWINFKWLHNFTIQGTGTVDGQGSNWWSLSQVHYIQVIINSIDLFKDNLRKEHEKSS